MTWIDGLFNVHSALQTVVVLSLICSVGLALGKIHVRGVSLGIAFVFLVHMQGVIIKIIPIWT